MSRTASPCTGKPYDVDAACRVWNVGKERLPPPSPRGGRRGGNVPVVVSAIVKFWL